MTNQEKKDYLSQAYRLDRHIESLIVERDDITKLKDKCMKCTVSYENDGSQSGSHSNSTESALVTYIDRLSEYEQELTQQIDKYLDIKRKIKQIIALVPQKEHQDILMKRYINFEKWEQIACEMNYSYRHTTKLHKEAIEKMEIAL